MVDLGTSFSCFLDKIQLKVNKDGRLCFPQEDHLAFGNQKRRFVVLNWRTKQIVHERLFDAPIVKIQCHDGYYVITTTNGTYLDTHKHKYINNVYPLELYPGYFKGNPVISFDMKHLAFFANNFDVVVFQLPAIK